MMTGFTASVLGLNAPYGAWCFLTAVVEEHGQHGLSTVLMRLMALGAF